MAALLARMGKGTGHSPMLVGWADDNIRFGIRFGPEKPVLALTAGAVLGATLEVDTLVYCYEALRNQTPYVKPQDDILSQQVLYSLAWSKSDEGGWVSVLHRDDDGSTWYGDPEPFFDKGGPFDAVIRCGWTEPDDFDKLIAWMNHYHHDVRVY